jgi:hypothetical protein
MAPIGRPRLGVSALVNAMPVVEAPPIIKPRDKSGRRLFLSFAAIMVGVFAWGVITRIPPNENKLMERFNAHRGAFERLKDMLQEDSQVVCVRPYYGLTTKQGTSISAARTKEYQACLKDTGGSLLRRRGSGEGAIEILLWSWGGAFADRDVGVSYEYQPPTNTLPALFGRRPPGNLPGRDLFYKHVDHNWYLWANF